MVGINPQLVMHITACLQKKCVELLEFVHVLIVQEGGLNGLEVEILVTISADLEPLTNEIAVHKNLSLGLKGGLKEENVVFL